MKNVNKAIGMMMITLMMGSAALAEGTSTQDPTSAPKIEKRVERQKKRISNKLAKGKITQDQANNLNQKVDEVKAKETELAKDGKLTKQERKELHKELNQNSKDIKAAAGVNAKAPATGTN